MSFYSWRLGRYKTRLREARTDFYIIPAMEKEFEQTERYNKKHMRLLLKQYFELAYLKRTREINGKKLARYCRISDILMLDFEARRSIIERDERFSARDSLDLAVAS